MRRPALGFLGAWFFLILAPTSSFIPIEDAAFEHRMYLPLAALGGDFWPSRGWQLFARLQSRRRPAAMAAAADCQALALVALALMALGGATIRRNADYHSQIEMLRKTVDQAPNNVRTLNNLAAYLNMAHEFDEAAKNARAAIALEPDNAEAHNDLAVALDYLGRNREAIQEYRRALDLRPENAEWHYNFGSCLIDEHRTEEAIDQFRRTVALAMAPKKSQAWPTPRSRRYSLQNRPRPP